MPLQQDLPGSTTLDIPTIKAFIQYKLEASLCDKLTESIELKFKSNSTFPNSENEIHRSIPIKSCCCVNKGMAEITISANKYEYICGDVIKINVKGDRVKIPKILCRLYRTIFVRSNIGNAKVAKDIILEAEIQGNSLDIDLKSVESRIYNESSTKGKKVCCMYSLNFTGNVNAVCARDGAEINLSINIFTPHTTVLQIPRYAVPWRPRVFKNHDHLDESNLDEDNYSL